MESSLNGSRQGRESLKPAIQASTVEPDTLVIAQDPGLGVIRFG